MIKNIICDLDDTLILTNIHYLNAINYFAEYIEKETGIPKINVIEIEGAIDLQCALINAEYHKDRFPHSFYITSTVCDQILNMPIDVNRANISYTIANNVYNEKLYQVFPETINFLNWCISQNYNLYLWSKGDITIQLQKLEHTGVLQYFSHINIHIVTKKDVTGLESIINIHNLYKEECLIVGDSLRDEISCAHKCNIKSAWIENKNSSWKYNNGVHLYDYVVKTLMELPAIITAHNR